MVGSESGAAAEGLAALAAASKGLDKGLAAAGAEALSGAAGVSPGTVGADGATAETGGDGDGDGIDDEIWELGDLGDDVSVHSEELQIDVGEKLDLRPAGLSAEQSLAWWLSFASHNYADLCEELGGNESCLLCVEGLILRLAAGQERLSISQRQKSDSADSTNDESTEEMFDLPGSVRTFSFIFQFERFMEMLVESGMVNIQLVFFNDLKFTLARQHASLWTIREILRLHCGANSGRFTHRVFNNWQDAAFLEMLRARHPFVFLCEDGSALVQPRSVFSDTTSGSDDADSNSKSDDDATEGEEESKGSNVVNGKGLGNGAGEHGYGPLYSLALRALAEQMTVAFLYGLNKNGARIKANTIGTESFNIGLLQQTQAAVLDKAQEENAAFDAQVAAEFPALRDSSHPLLKFVNKGQPLRLACAASVVQSVGGADDKDWNAFFAKAFLLHSILLAKTPLQSRWIALAPIDTEIYSTTLEFFVAQLQALLATLPSLGALRASDADLASASAPSLTAGGSSPTAGGSSPTAGGSPSTRGAKSLYESMPASDADREALADLFDEALLRQVIVSMVHAKEGGELGDEKNSEREARTEFDSAFFGLSSEETSLLESAFADILGDKEGEEERSAFFPISLAFLDAEGEGEGEDSMGVCDAVGVEKSGDLLRPEFTEKMEIVPGLLGVKDNDFYLQMLGSSTGKLVNNKGEELARMNSPDAPPPLASPEEFLAAHCSVQVGDDAGDKDGDEEGDKPERKAKMPIEAPKDAPLLSFQRHTDFDVATAHASAHKENLTERKLPRWIERLTGEAREKGIKKWEMKRVQEAKVFARNINKYFGSLDRFHHPIVLVGGKARSDHPWFCAEGAGGANEAAAEAANAFKPLPGESNAAAEKRRKKELKEQKEREKEQERRERRERELKESAAGKGSGSKAAAIIAKNMAAQAEKERQRQQAAAAHLYVAVDHVFSKKTTKPSTFNDAFLEILVGPRNAVDTNVLEEFHAIKATLSLPESQLEFLAALAQRLFYPLEHTWTEKEILSMRQERQLLKLMGTIFRFVQVTLEKFMKLMTAAQIRTFQELLLILGFRRSSRNVFEAWAERKWQAKRAALLDKSRSGKKKGAAGETGRPLTKAELKAAAKAAAKAEKAAKTSGDQSKDERDEPENEEGGSHGKEGKEVKGSEDDALKAEKAAEFEKLEKEAFVKEFNKRFDFAVKPDLEATFQMQYLGADMTRTLGSITDPRVTFTPDGWQKQLLDTVDAQESCLVVAPTASGKTFACYYAMDQALRYDNEACVIFVSPTRALALQVESEVIARFSAKTYPPGCKTLLCGHLFEDRAQNWNNCQILITVPSVLDPVLSSTNPEIKDWQKRVKYAILDEVHCIGEEKAGRQFENLIQLLPCPFMALSATVGNEASFSSWLSRAQSFPGAKPVRYIKHDERYADLQTLYFSNQNSSLYSLNPMLCLDIERVKKGTLTGDFFLVPTDAMTTFEALSRILSVRLQETDASFTAVQRELVETFITEYHPERFFCGSQAITKKQYRRFLGSLLGLMEHFAITGVLPENSFLQLVSELAAVKPLSETPFVPWWKIKNASAASIQPKKAAASQTSQTSALTSADGLSVAKATLDQMLPMSGRAVAAFNEPAQFLDLLRQLETRRLLPALVFNFNRAFASRLFYRLVNKLVDEHHAKFYGTPEATARTKALNKKLQDEYKGEIARREMAEKWKTLSKEQRAEQGIDERIFAELTGPLPMPPTDVALDHDPDFYLNDRRMYMSNLKEFEGVMQFCRIEYLVKMGKIPTILVEGLKRGIGLYHDALHREYRRAVEFLFRMRYLRVVVSDVSLSQGVNMPCKTTIFAGDSSALTPLLYRQTAGRAGRRGFDSLGNVVFWEFPFKKIRRLICSRLAHLSGAFAVRPTTVLKAMNLADNLTQQTLLTVQAKMAQKPKAGASALTQSHIFSLLDANREKVRKLFSEPLFAVGASGRVSAHLEDNTRVSYVFAVDLLRRLGLLDHAGAVDMFSAVVFALGVAEEPGNLFLALCILKGLLTTNSSSSSSSSDDDASPLSLIDTDLLHLFCFSVGRKEFSHNVVRRVELAGISNEVERILLPNRGAGDLLTPTSSFAPLLPPLKPRAAQLAEAFDRCVFDTAVSRCRAQSLTHDRYNSQEFALPISDVILTTQDLISDACPDSYPFKSFQKKTVSDKSRYSHCSPLAYGTGEPRTVEQLIGCVRNHIYVESDLMPQVLAKSASLRFPGESRSVKMPLINNYAVSLMQHGSLRRVIENNDIRAADAYYVMLDLKGTLKRFSDAVAAYTRWADNELTADAATILNANVARLAARAKEAFAGVKM